MGFDPSSDGEDGGDVDGGFRPSSLVGFVRRRFGSFRRRRSRREVMRK